MQCLELSGLVDEIPAAFFMFVFVLAFLALGRLKRDALLGTLSIVPF